MKWWNYFEILEDSNGWPKHGIGWFEMELKLITLGNGRIYVGKFWELNNEFVKMILVENGNWLKGTGI